MWPKPPLRQREGEAEAYLREAGLLDSDEDNEIFTIITGHAQNLLRAPVALASLVSGERQWWKAHPGMEMYTGEGVRQLPRDEGWCGWVVGENEPVVTLNAALDDRFKDNPAFAQLGIEFYAGVPLRTENDVPIGAFCVLGPARSSFDETDLKALQDLAQLAMQSFKLIRRNRMLENQEQTRQANAQQKIASLAGLAHELRTPLNGIVSMIECLGDLELSDTALEYVSIMQGSSVQLQAILNDILTWAKLESGAVELERVQVSMRKLVEGVLDILSSNAVDQNTEIGVQIMPNLSDICVCADPTRLRQILLNLVSNAIKFTKNGNVVVNVQKEANASGEPDRLRIDVVDDGIGINAADQDKLFQPFTQATAETNRKYGGTGLGLAICRKLVHIMDGSIALHSTPGKGTTFTVSIPVQQWFVPVEPTNFAPLCATVTLRSGFQSLLLANQLQLLGVRVVDETYSALDQTVAFTDGKEAKTRSKATVYVVPLTSKHARADAICLAKPLHLGKIINCLDNVLHKRVAKPMARPQPINGFSELRVLLVDDNMINVKIACRMLERAGVGFVKTSTTGKECLEKLERSLVEKKPFSIILMDFNMPEMDGPTATRIVRTDPRFQRVKDTPILGWTALPQEQAIKECLDCGMTGALVKPATLNSLKEALKQFCPASS